MNLIEAIKKILFKRKNYIYYVISLCIGIMLMLGSKITSEKNSKINLSDDDKNIISTTSEANDFNIETKLINILEKVDGVGDVDVMIYYNTQSDKSFNKSSDESYGVIFGTQNDSKNNHINTIEGVIIVAECENDIKLNVIKSTVSDILGIPIHRVSVLKMKI